MSDTKRPRQNPDPAKFYMQVAVGVKMEVRPDAPDIEVPMCRAHHRWPCIDCGTQHFDGCECQYCEKPTPSASNVDAGGVNWMPPSTPPCRSPSVSELTRERVMGLKEYAERFVGEREALYGDNADENGADKAKLAIALADHWLTPALDERKGEPNYEKLPAIQLCSRAALDLFLSAYWPELLRDLNDHARLVRELEIESIKLDAETRHAEAMRLQLRTAVSRISELERRVEAAEADAQKWRALMNCRMRTIGSAKVNDQSDPWTYITMEFWTGHPDTTDQPWIYEHFGRFIQKAIAALPAEAEGKKCAACGSDIPGGCPSCTGTDEGGGRL